MTDLSIRVPQRTVPPREREVPATTADNSIIPPQPTTRGGNPPNPPVRQGESNPDELRTKAYDSYTFNRTLEFGNQNHDAIKRSVSTLINQKLDIPEKSKLTRDELKTMAANLVALGGLSQLDSATKAKFVQATGIESDENLIAINSIINNPNFNNFPSCFTGIDLLKICKDLKAKGMSDQDIKESFLDPLVSKMGDIDQARNHIKATCMANQIVFHENLLKDENRFDPFLSDTEAVRKGNDEEKLTPLFELRGKQVTTSQHNSGVVEVLAGLLGYDRNTTSHEQILRCSLPKFIIDEMKAARSEEDVTRIFNKYDVIIRQAIPQPSTTAPSPTPAPVPPSGQSAVPPPPVSENKENAAEDRVVTNTESNTANNDSTVIQSESDLKSYITNNVSSISAEKIALIAKKVSHFGGLQSLDSETKQILKTNLGIESDENLRTINEIVSDRNYGRLSRVFNSEQLLDLCKKLKEKGLSDSEIKLVFLDGLLSAVKSGNVDRAKEHIKDACREQNIVFNPDLHTPEYASNPFLTDRDKTRISEWENQGVSILELKNETIDRTRRHGGVLGFVLGAVNLNGSSSSSARTANVTLPRYIVNEIKNARNEEEVRAIAEKYKDIIVRSFQVTESRR